MLIKNICLVALLALPAFASAANIDQAINSENNTQILGQKSQQSINQWHNETQQMLRQYQQLMQQSDYQQAYNDELKQSLIEQQQTIENLKKQLADVQVTRLHIMPFLREKTADLKQFIELDLPFQQDARLKSVERLQDLLASSKASLAEKYRRLMEAWQAESDLSYQINSYRGEVEFNGQNLSVEFLQVGRLALLFQTLDGAQSAYWQPQQKQWLALPSSNNHAIKTAIRVANKQLPPQLLHLPLAMQEAK